MACYKCSVCGIIYDEEKEKKKWDQLPDDWICTVCDSGKSYFKHMEESETKSSFPPASSQPLTKGVKKKMMVCRVCGYIIEERHLGEKCPACGVPKTAFQPYMDNVSEKRRKILNLHLHNIMVHFPQAFSVFMLFLIGMGFILQGSLETDALTAARVLSIFLPLSVAASIISGLLDGKNRFKRLTTPMLKKKILVGTLFFILSVGVLLVLVFSNLQSGWHAVSAALTALCVLCSLFLGYNGGRLAGTIVPG